MNQGFEVGGKNAWKVKTRNGYGIAFHWIAEDPAMVFFPLDAALKGHSAAVFAIPLEVCHQFVKAGTKGAEVDGHALFLKAEQIARVIGRGGDTFLARDIADAILDSLDELCDMPPEPQWLALKKQLPPAGQAIFIQRDRKTGHEEIVAERDI